MAIHSIGLSEFASTNADSKKRFTVRPNSPFRSLFLKWRTASGLDVNASFDIALNYRVVPKVTTEGGGISGWATDWGTWAKVNANSCNMQYVDGGYQWSLNFATLLGMKNADVVEGGLFLDGNVDIMSILFRSGKFYFENRYYDRVEFGIRIKSNYIKEEDGGISGADETIGKQGTATASPRTDTTFTIDYVPEYRITGIYCDSLDSVKIECESSDLWLRADDRFCVESLRIGVDEEGNGGVEIAASKPWGTLVLEDGKKVAVVPMSSLSDIPLGETVSVGIRFNPSYGTAGEEFARASFSDTCEGGNASQPFFLTSSNINGLLEIKPQDLGEGSSPITHCLVKMRGSDNPFDQAVIPIDKWTALPFIPRGIPVTFKAFGVAEDGSVSNAVMLTVEMEPIGWLMLVSLKYPSLMATASYDIDVKRRKHRESEIFKLADRDRQSACYGKGGKVSIDASFSIPHKCMVEHPSETEDAWWNIAMAGDCVMLTADGKRAVVTVEDVDATEPADDDHVTMSVSLSEVSA